MEEYVWLNDDLILLDQALISVNDRGFLYGDGFFETLRAEAGTVFFLKEHLDRLRASATTFRLPWSVGLDWRQRLDELLTANGLAQSTARVKILLSRGAAAGLGLPEAARPTLVIWAQPYAPPPPAEYVAGWPVITFPEWRSTFVGRYKSLNYLFYLTARQFALDWGAKEAVILEADGLVSEAAAANLIFLREGLYYTPEAVSALPGVTLAALARVLARESQTLEAVRTTPAQLAQVDGIWLVNALMGLMPVSSLDGWQIPVSPKSAELQELLWTEARREA